MLRRKPTPRETASRSRCRGNFYRINRGNRGFNLARLSDALHTREQPPSARGGNGADYRQGTMHRPPPEPPLLKGGKAFACARFPPPPWEGGLGGGEGA